MKKEARGILLILNNRNYTDWDFNLPAAEKLGKRVRQMQQKDDLMKMYSVYSHLHTYMC